MFGLIAVVYFIGTQCYLAKSLRREEIKMEEPFTYQLNMTKSEYKVVYRRQTCPFLPTEDESFEEMPDVVEGKVLCLEV